MSFQPFPDQEMPWYTRGWVTVLALILFLPAGLLLMWKYQKWDRGIKTTVTVVPLLLFAVFMAKSDKLKARMPGLFSVQNQAPNDEPASIQRLRNAAHDIHHYTNNYIRERKGEVPRSAYSTSDKRVTISYEAQNIKYSPDTLLRQQRGLGIPELLKNGVKTLTIIGEDATGRYPTREVSAAQLRQLTKGSPGEPIARIDTFEVFPYTTPEGEKAAKFSIHWSNTGSKPIRELRVDILTYDPALKRMIAAVQDHAIYSAPNSTPGIKPNQSHIDPENKGLVVLKEPYPELEVSPQTLKVRISSVSEKSGIKD